MTKRINFSKSSRELLIDMLNHKQGQLIPISIVDFGIPVALTAPEQAEHGTNTVIRLSAKPLSGYTGDVDVYYNRVDLHKLFREVGVVGVDAAFSTLEEALALINQKYGLAISINELVPTTVTNSTVILRIAQSEVFQPNTQIVVSNDIKEQTAVDLESQIAAIEHVTYVVAPTVINAPLIV